MDTFISALVSGVSQGGIAIMAASGLVVIHKATGIVNFAHGDVLTVGAYIAFVLVSLHGVPVVLAYLLAIVAAGIIGLGMERFAYRPIRNRSPLNIMVIMFAFGLLLRAIMIEWQGTETHPLPSLFGNGVIRLGEAVVPYQSIVILVVTAMVVATLVLVFEKTQIGRQLRALADDRETAFLTGIRGGALSGLAFAVAGVLAGVGGVLLAPVLSVSPGLGFGVLLTAFAATVLGGNDRLIGVAVAGLFLGLIQAFATSYISSAYSSAYPFIVLMIVLAIRPEGLFQAKVRVRY